MKKNVIGISILVVLFVILVFVESNRPTPFSWQETYSSNDQIPYGTYLVYENLDVLYPEQPVKKNLRPLYHTFPQHENQTNNLIMIASNFDFPDLEVKELIQFAEKGNHVFIASQYIGENLLDTLNLKVETRYIETAWEMDSIANTFDTYIEDTLRCNFTHPQFKADSDYTFDILHNYTAIDSMGDNTTILGKISIDEKINFVRTKVGDGYIYIHTTPGAFTNYYVAHPKNHEYAFKALSHLPNQPVIWDEYYNKQRRVGKSASPLRFFMSEPALKAFAILAIILMLMYIFLYGRRRQRAIPVTAPPRNATLDFIRTISSLYFNSENHKNIADKKINYFFDYLRNEFQVRTNELDADFIQHLADKSEVPFKQVKGLINYIKFLKGKLQVDDEELIKLNEMITNFYNAVK